MTSFPFQPQRPRTFSLTCFAFGDEQLFILRMNIHLVGSIVDSPEIFWAQPDLEPLYSAARSYLEIPQRIDLLNQRVEVSVRGNASPVKVNELRPSLVELTLSIRSLAHVAIAVAVAVTPPHRYCKICCSC